jgi:hypothetical protein|tara:strand:+ start:667 stop:861 length:195 start_codon:yes stop_codon:yes gene_type:complete
VRIIWLLQINFSIWVFVTSRNFLLIPRLKGNKIVYISFKRDISKVVKNPDKKNYLETQIREASM